MPPSQWDRGGLSSGRVQGRDNWTDIEGDILSGRTVVFAAGAPTAWSADSAKFQQRAVERPATEMTVRGPDEAFNEVLATQIAQLRRVVQTPSLQVRTVSVGPTFGKVALVYLEGVANPVLVQNVWDRLARVPGRTRAAAASIAGVIRDEPLSIFPTIRNTERVGLVAARLAEGKVAILVDGDPFALVAPSPIADFYRTEQDYGGAWYDASFVRLIRFVGWGVGVYLPALYVAATQVDPNVIPMSLLITISGSRAGLPSSPLAGVLVMVLVLETLREAAFRLPKVLGTTIGTVGAIVVGTAIVSAGLVSPQVIVVITLTALSFYTAPVYELTATWRVVNFAMLLAAAFLGIVGIVAVTMLLLVQLSAMTSFGVPYFAPWEPLRLSDWGDTILRLPWTLLRRRLSGPLPVDPGWPPVPRMRVPRLRRAVR